MRKFLFSLLGLFASVYSFGQVPLSTGTISPTNFCLGTTLSVPYSVNFSNFFQTGNKFTAQLSDATGSFASPVNIGYKYSTTSGTITAAIPASSAAGSGYRIRVIGSFPTFIPGDNGSDLTIGSTPLLPSVTAVGPTTLCAGSSAGLFASDGTDKALQLNGVNGTANMGSWFNYQDFTIEAWVRPGATQVDFADIMDNNHTASRSWVIQQNGSNINQYTFFTANPLNSAITFNLVANVWQHLAVTSDWTGKIKVYVDGVLIGTSQGAYPINYDGTQNLRLGSWGGGGRNWNGRMDEVKIFSLAKSQAGIQADMNQYSAPTETGLVAYYTMNESEGSPTISDATNKGHTGVVFPNGTYISPGALGNSTYTSYTWSNGGSGIFHPVNATGDYYVTVTNAAGCNARSNSIHVTINPASTISYAGSPFCQSGVKSVTRTGPAGGTYSAPAGLFLNASSGTIIPAASTPGTYTVTYSGTANGCALNATTSVTIVSTPKITYPAITALCVDNTNGSTASVPYSVVSGTPTQYDVTASANSPMPNFQPVVGATLNPNNFTVDIPAGTPAGQYYFDLYLMTAEGCMSGKYVFGIKVTGACPVASPVGTGVPARFVHGSIKGTQSDLENSIVIAPNPVRRMLNIEVATQGSRTVRITSAEGRMLISNARFNSYYSFDMSGYAPGIYIVEVMNETTGDVVRKKVVKQ